MRMAFIGWLGMLLAIAFGITGAIWVGLHLGGWGLAVITGLALGIPVAVLMGTGRSRPVVEVRNPMGGPWAGRGDVPGIVGGDPWAAPAGQWGMTGPSRVPFGPPFPMAPWISWIAWMPGPSAPEPPRGGWPLLPPSAPRTFTVIGEDEAE